MENYCTGTERSKGDVSTMRTLKTLVIALAFILAPLQAIAGGKETATIWSAIQVLEDVLVGPDEESIPSSLLQKGDGVIILPGMISVGFGVGVRHGNGVMLFRKDKEWNNPVFVSMSGASYGYQIGAQSSDVILSIKRPNSIESLLDGKLTLGVDASMSAGPIGRDTTAATDPLLRTEIYSWSRSKGLFAGVALDGSILTINDEANARFYDKPGISASDIIEQPTNNRSSGLRRLKELLNQHITRESP